MSSLVKHFVLAPLPAIGHIRPQVAAACKLVSADTTATLTILSPKFLHNLTEQEVNRANLEKEARSRIRVIGAGQVEPPPKGVPDALIKLIFPIGTDMADTYRDIVRLASYTCTATGQVYNFAEIAPPTAVFIDGFLPMFPDVVKEISPAVRIVHFWFGTACSWVALYAPAKWGGTFEVEVETREAYEKGDMDTVAQAMNDCFGSPKGKPYPNPEHVQLYDYELVPQGGSFQEVRIAMPPRMFIPVMRFGTQIADAVLIMMNRLFQPKQTEVMIQWFEKEMGKRVFFFGPQISPGSPPPQSLIDSTNPSASIFRFLDSHRPKSVILISFGTMYYPIDEPWRIEAVITSLLNARQPFILSRFSLTASKFNRELEARVENSGDIALVASFVPQQEVLAHPSIGAFLTHGGVNSMCETIAAGVLPIFWPIHADQPLHAAYLTLNRDCAFELMQVRTGIGAQRPMRGGKIERTPEAIKEEVNQVLADLSGAEGERKRRNLEIVRQEFVEAMKPGGEVDAEVRCLSEFLAV